MYTSIFALNKADMIKTQYIGFTSLNDWNCNKYKVILKNGGKQFTLDYHMGLAHKNPPKLSDVLYSLIMDSESLELNFSDWCNMLGYNQDSIKDKKIYSLCQKNGKGLQKLFNQDEIQNFKELLQDY